MLSMAAIPSAQDASAYYFRSENYYALGEAANSAVWHGTGATALGLEGLVDKGLFGQLLAGVLPNGVRLGRSVADTWKHFPGVDLTFSAPKSVSLLAYIGGDKRLLDANLKAVRSTLDWVEKNLVATRVKNGRDTLQERTGSLVAALFPHDVSRALEPQAHVHSIVMNATQRQDGKWGSVHNPPLWRDTLLLGRIYRGNLEANVRGLGYETRATHRDGRFEIEGVPRAAIDHFSTRSKEIEDLFQTFDHKNTRTRDIAAIMSRSRKQTLNRDALGLDWSDRAAQIGFDANALVAIARSREATPQQGDAVEAAPMAGKGGISALRDRLLRFFIRSEQTKDVRDDVYAIREPGASDARIRARSAVSFALRTLSEREAAFRENDIRAEAFNAGIPGLRIQAVDFEISELKKEGLVLEGPDRVAQMVTTEGALKLERDLIKETRGALASGRPVVTGRMAANRAIAGYGLNPDQASAALSILTSKDRVLGVQGYAGTGKTRMLRAVAEVTAASGMSFVGLAPTNSAKEVLARETGVPARTLQHFLLKYDGVARGCLTRAGRKTLRREYQTTVLVVDESSMISSRQMHDLLKIANTLEIPRLVLLGDSKQLAAIEAGKPFKLLQENGMKTAMMRTLLRQQRPELKGAVEDIIHDRVAASFRRIEKGVIETGSDRIAETAARLWAMKSPQAREQTLVIAASNRIRRDINEMMRGQIASEGGLKGPEISHTILENRHLSREELRTAAAYEPGDEILFHRDMRALNIKAGDLRSVKEVDIGNAVVTIADARGRAREFRPGLMHADQDRSYVEVLREEQIPLRVGEQVRWTGSDMDRGIINGQRASITGLGDDAISFKMEDGSKQIFAPDDPALKRLDHGYALTAYASQGRTSDHVIAALSAAEKVLTNRQTFYVEISRARTDVSLVVDSREDVVRELQLNSGEKSSAIETLRLPGEEGYVGVPSDKQQDASKDIAAPEPEQHREAQLDMEIGLS